MSDTSDQTPQEVFVADPTKHAFVTMAICGDSYTIGAMTLAHSIKKHGSTASCVVLVSSDVSDNAKTQLKKVFNEVVVVPVFEVKVPTVKGETEDRMKLFTHAFTKLHALKLVQYEKICLLDADSICVSNPDSIFQVQTPAGICSGIKNDNTHHGKPIDYKIIEKCYKEAGFPGNTYLLRPSISDFDRAVKLLAIKVKVTQVSIVQTKGAIPKSKVTGKSAFAGFDDDDDDDNENPEDDVDEAIIQQAPREDIVKTTKFLTKEDLEMTRFEDDKTEKKKIYPFEIFESSDVAPLGFSYDGKKSNMNQDERLFVDLYLKQWKHLHQRYGFLSWKKPSKNALPPIFLHFTQKPWAVQTDGQDVSRWADLVYFDFAAIDLYKAFSNDKDAVEFIRKSFPAIDDKVQQQANGTLILPVQSEPEVKSATTTTTTPTTTTTTTTTTSTIPTPTPTTTSTSSTGTTAAVPKQSAWKKV